MAEFVRARTSEQKALRLEQIKDCAKSQFKKRPYHEITLTTIAQQLGWSRANLYKYTTTKEEIFLLIMADELAHYTQALLSALPSGSALSNETIAEVWGCIANAHRDMFQYGNLLIQVIETNVTVEKLMDFKASYYAGIESMKEQLPVVLSVDENRIQELANSIYHHGVGLAGSCANNPLVQEALKRLGIKSKPLDFKAQMSDFIAMCLAWHQQR